MASASWLIACVVLDIGVIFTNVCEQLMISIKWNTLHKIDHLLFSLSISDLVCGLGALGADSWHLWNVTQNRNTSMNNSYGDSSLRNTTSYDQVSINQSIIHRIFDLVFIFSLFASAFHVMYLAAERACAIRFPGVYMLFIRFTFKFAILSAIWIISLIVTPTLAFTVNHNRAMKLAFGIILATTMIIVLCTNTAVAIFVRKSATHEINVDSRSLQERKKCLAIMCIFLGFSFFACMLPITLGYFHEDHYHYFSNLMVTLNSFINPCIYFVTVYWDAKITKRGYPKMENELMSLDIDDGHALVLKAIDF